MKYLKYKDNKKRYLFKNFELKNKIKYFVYKHILAYTSYNFILNSTSTTKKLILYKILKKKKKKFSTQLIRRCILTNRSKSFRPFKMSRIVVRELMGFGIIPGYTKAVW
jgi:ribosomal protein S14